MKFIDEKGNLFGKINVIDFVVLLAVLAAAVVFAFSWISGYMGDKTRDTKKAEEKEFIMEFYADEVADYVVEHLKEGAELYDADSAAKLGEVVSFETGPSRVYVTNEAGEIVVSEKEGYSSLTIVGKVTATQGDGGIEVSGCTYGVGHTMTLRAGNAKIYLKVSDFSEIQ